MLRGDAKNPIFMVAKDRAAAEFLSLGFLQKPTFLAMGRQGRVCGSQRPEHSVRDHSKGGDTCQATNTRFPRSVGSKLLPHTLASWRLQAGVLAPSAPGTPTELSGRSTAIPRPLPAPVPASSWAGSMCLGCGCAPQCSTHHSGQARPGRAPPLAVPHPLAASAAAPAPSLPGDTWEQVGPSVPESHPRQVAACWDL